MPADCTIFLEIYSLFDRSQDVCAKAVEQNKLRRTSISDWMYTSKATSATERLVRHMRAVGCDWPECLKRVLCVISEISSIPADRSLQTTLMLSVTERFTERSTNRYEVAGDRQVSSKDTLGKDP